MLGQVMLEVDRTDRDDMMTVNQLRQDLVLTAGRHDAELGYQLLHSTQQQQPTQIAITPARGNQQCICYQGNNLEQCLLATVAVTDPKFAYQKAVESLDKGEFPTSLSRILTQLQTKDAELFKKLSDKTLNRLGSDSLLASREATSVAVNLLSPGPLPSSTASNQPGSTAANANANARAPILSESAYHDLMESAITAALSVTSMGPVNNLQRGGGAARVMRGPQQQQQQQQQQNPPDDATVRQNNARSILVSL